MITIQYKASVLLLCDLSQSQLRSPPVSSLGVVPDLVTSFHPNPLRNRTVLLLFLGQESLDSESLVRRHDEKPESDAQCVMVMAEARKTTNYFYGRLEFGTAFLRLLFLARFTMGRYSKNVICVVRD